MKIAVLSDIHAAASHFSDALADAREEGFDQLIILGDLLTYGPDPTETLDLAREARSRDGAIFIRGNHDILYGNDESARAYAARMPDWISHSVEWTSSEIGGPGSLDDLPWQDEWQHDEMLFSHANPFGSGDWSYLNNEQAFARAGEVLAARGLSWGIFGHVHRFRLVRPENGRAGVATVGSIGQPRDTKEPFGQWAMVTTGADVSVEQRRLRRGWQETIAKLREIPLPDETKERLCQFYR